MEGSHTSMDTARGEKYLASPDRTRGPSLSRILFSFIKEKYLFSIDTINDWGARNSVVVQAQCYRKVER
jgi:hypothetical protein